MDERETNGVDPGRRAVLAAGGLALAATVMPSSARAIDSARTYRRIACEEGFLSPGVLAQNARTHIAGVPLITAAGPAARLARPLLDIGEGRIAAMDADGIDMQLLMLSSPGIQIFDADTALSLAAESNDIVSDACARHPTRLAALAAVAPQNPAAAARELARAMKLPGMKGAIINSHTGGEYLDNPKFWGIFEALEALNVPLYLHPREPVGGMRDIMAGPVVGGAAWAYGVEVGTHILRLIQAGVFDRFPKLRIVIGHMGEAIPFWLPRIDGRFAAANRRMVGGARKIQRMPSDYVRQNIWVTTSGMNNWPQLEMTLKVLGSDRILYATDYPFEDQAEAVLAVESMPLSNEQKKYLFQDNAKNLFDV